MGNGIMEISKNISNTQFFVRIILNCFPYYRSNLQARRVGLTYNLMSTMFTVVKDQQKKMQFKRVTRSMKACSPQSQHKVVDMVASLGHQTRILSRLLLDTRHLGKPALMGGIQKIGEMMMSGTLRTIGILKMIGIQKTVGVVMIAGEMNQLKRIGTLSLVKILAGKCSENVGIY